jgi:phage repressor protein C with HTH and peptisase S24 domain
MKTYAERLNWAMNRETKKVSQTELAKKIGISPQSIQYLCDPERGAQGSKHNSKIAAELGISAIWLETGEGSPVQVDYLIEQTRGRSHGVEEATTLYLTAEDLADGPYVPIARGSIKLSAGVSGFAVEFENESEDPIFFRRAWYQRRGFQPEKLIALRVSGQSMESGLFDGDMVVVNTADQVPIDGEVFALNYEGELVIKRMKRDSGEWWLASDNPDKTRYPDKRCGEGVSIIGRVIHKQSERI